MLYLYCFGLLFILKLCYGLDNLEGWNYINLHCRDNDNRPLDWWYIYKPPSDYEVYFEFGRNFSYITPETEGRWQNSARYITESSMLHNTLSPLFKPTYVDYLAYVVYEQKEKTGHAMSSAAYGIMMADEMGGVWIVHTVPELPDLSQDAPSFPVKETLKGHLIMCMSLDLIAINEITSTLISMKPIIAHLQVPERMIPKLPEWKKFERPHTRSDWLSKTSVDFFTKYRSLTAVLMMRAPGDSQCLYEKFARNHKIMLDVYGPNEKMSNCYVDYGVRNINGISLKFPESVHYVHKRRQDKARFAISTAAHWQRVGGAGPTRFWTCISNLDVGDHTGQGGIIICVLNYRVWLSFDNFKIKEPSCPVTTLDHVE